MRRWPRRRPLLRFRLATLRWRRPRLLLRFRLAMLRWRLLPPAVLRREASSLLLLRLLRQIRRHLLSFRQALRRRRVRLP